MKKQKLRGKRCSPLPDIYTPIDKTSSVEISDQTVLEQVEHTFISPEAENMVGSAGKETWIFKGLEQGMSSISMEYSQPWEDGIKAEWTFNLTVFVK